MGCVSNSVSAPVRVLTLSRAVPAQWGVCLSFPPTPPPTLSLKKKQIAGRKEKTGPMSAISNVSIKYLIAVKTSISPSEHESPQTTGHTEATARGPGHVGAVSAAGSLSEGTVDLPVFTALGVPRPRPQQPAAPGPVGTLSPPVSLPLPLQPSLLTSALCLEHASINVLRFLASASGRSLLCVSPLHRVAPGFPPAPPPGGRWVSPILPLWVSLGLPQGCLSPGSFASSRCRSDLVSLPPPPPPPQGSPSPHRPPRPSAAPGPHTTGCILQFDLKSLRGFPSFGVTS